MSNAQDDTAARPATGTDAAAHDEFVAQVRQAWLDVLGVEDISLDVNFFEAGGNSLLLIMLQAELSSLTSRDLPIADLFRCNTIRGQVRWLLQA